MLVLLFLSLSISAQTKRKLPLPEVLSYIETNYQCKFSYANDVVSNITITKPSKSFTLSQVISFLKKNTPLKYDVLHSKLITISKKKVSYTLCGYVIDNVTGEPLEMATVNTSSNSSTTDEFGYFKIDVKSETETITVRYLGYNASQKTYNDFLDVDCLNIYLEEDFESLSEVVVLNYLTKGISKVVDGTFHINYANFGALPGLIETDVLQTIQTMPGINSANETVSNINIRGGTHDQSLILWDDVKMYQTSHFFGLISMFNPLITTDVTLHKNGTNVGYSDGVSGTIAMKTDREINRKFKTNLGVNLVNADIFFDVPLGEKSSLQLSGRKAINSYVETPTYKNYFNRVSQDSDIESYNESTEGRTSSDLDFDFYDTSLRWLYNPTEKDQIRVNFIYANNDLIFKETKSVSNKEVQRLSDFFQNNISGGINYRRRWSDYFTTNLNIYETDYNLKARNIDADSKEGVLQKNKVSETSIKLNAWLKHNEQLTVMGGYQFTESGITNKTDVYDPRFFRSIVEVLREHALYTQANYSTPAKDIHIKIGGRYSYIEQFNRHFVEPRLSVHYKLNDKISFDVLGEFKHQNTTQIIDPQNDFLGIEKRRWQLADNNKIPIIKSKQASVGANFSDKGWLVTLEGYYKQVDDIVSISQGFVNQYEFLPKPAIGSYNVIGADVFVNKRFKSLSVWLGYAYADNNYNFESFEEKMFPNNIDINHNISAGIAYSAKSLKISTGLNWYSGKPTTLPNDEQPIVNGSINYMDANSSRMGEYLRIDASAIYEFRLNDIMRLKLGASVWNLSRERNTVSSYFTREQGNVEEVVTNALKQTLNFTMRLIF